MQILNVDGDELALARRANTLGRESATGWKEEAA